MAYQGGNKSGARRAERSAINREDKLRLVEEGRAHGVLVYADAEPIGWCQFGSLEELPIEWQGSPFGTEPSGEQVWRITCFVTHKAWQGRGVARTALHAALEAIAAKGGGVVEAYPFARAAASPAGPEPARIEREFSELVHTFGRNSAEVKASWYRREKGVAYEAGKPVVVEEVIDGVGVVNALCRFWTPAFHVGTVAMFEREGFKPVAKIESTGRRQVVPKDGRDSGRVHPTRVVMQKVL